MQQTAAPHRGSRSPRMHELRVEPQRRNQVERLRRAYQELFGALVERTAGELRRAQLSPDCIRAVDDGHGVRTQRVRGRRTGDAGADDNDAGHQRAATSDARAAITTGSSFTDAV